MTDILIGVVVVAIAIYAMIGVSMSNMTQGRKMTWFAIVVLLPLVGPILYFVLKPNK
jgi:hypothetical protein